MAADSRERNDQTRNRSEEVLVVSLLESFGRCSFGYSNLAEKRH